MRIRHLYLNIYLTVVALLLLFALVTAWVVHRNALQEHGRVEKVVGNRMAAWVELLENSLPGAEAPREVQQTAFLDWARRLRVGIALDDAQGQRLAASELFLERQARHEEPADFQPVRFALSDGRVLWVARGRLGSPAGDESHHHPPGTRLLHGPPEGAPWLLLGVLALLFISIAVGSYPVVRRLTRRLESLKRGVEAFGAGDLGRRIAVEGRDEVAALAQSFNQAAGRIEELIRANKSLLANASHELRSPLARLKMALAMLPESGVRSGALREEIARDIAELDGLVEEVLLASRLDAQSVVTREPVELLGIAAEECARIDADLEPDLPAGFEPVVTGDERLLRRALRNLLENGRRYGGGQVECHLGPGPQGGVRLAVCDRGPGVPEDQRERIFEPFYRLPGHAERAGGVGLGLSLVRQIVQRHGGQVRCEGRTGGGSCFVIELPRPESQDSCSPGP
jgi:signal transduction histidine kinase